MKKSLKDQLKTKEPYIPTDFDELKKLFDHFRGKTIDEIEGDLRPLLNSKEAFYISTPTAGLLQGDILQGINAAYIDSDGDAAQSTLTDLAMVLSNECDAELREKNHQGYIRVCPVYRESDLIASQDMNSSFIGTLRANRINEYFRMPPFEENFSLVADLSLIYSVDLPYLHFSINEGKIKRIASLSKDAYFLLQMKLAWLMLRPTKDSKRYLLK